MTTSGQSATRTHLADRILDRAGATAPVVVGIDPDIDQIGRLPFISRVIHSDPQKALITWCRAIIDGVADLVPVVKPQSAYFEMFGSAGIAALEDCIDYARAAGLHVILDAKRGDIPSTAEAYARAYLKPERGPHALTVNPFLGVDSLTPFINRLGVDNAIFACVRTSNPGAGDFQDILDVDGRCVSERVAAALARLYPDCAAGETGYTGLGAVVAATYPELAQSLRAILHRSIFLVPGIGHQGGQTSTLPLFFDENGQGALVTTSRRIAFGGPSEDSVGSYTEAVRDRTALFVREVLAALNGR